MRSLIPNILTASNLILGVFAIIFTFHGQLSQAAFFVVAAMVADGLDGRAARYFKASSEFGKELDSLCDLVSFGVAPAILAYNYFLQEFGLLGMVTSAIFATCGALRLARFNVNTGVVKGFFMGLPIPAAGCVVATFVMTGLKLSGLFFPIFTLIIAFLMISTIRYPDFKGKGEKIRVIPAVISLAISIYILNLTINAIIFVPFFTYTLFGILNTIFGLFESKPVI